MSATVAGCLSDPRRELHHNYRLNLSTAPPAAAVSHAEGYWELMPETSTTPDLIQKQTSYTGIDEARAAAERLAEERG